VKGLQESRIYLVDNRRELSLKADPQTCIRIMAAIEPNTESLEDLLEGAAYFDGSITPDLLNEAEDIVHRSAPFRVDLSNRRIVYDSSIATFSRRGVLAHKNGAGLDALDLRTYALPPDYEVYDSYLNRPLDNKGSIRREKDLWSEAVGGIAAGHVRERAKDIRVDGLDLVDLDLHELELWTKTEDEGPPLVDGKSVYEFRLLRQSGHRATPRRVSH